MPQPHRFSLGDFRLKLDMPNLQTLSNVKYPSPTLQRKLLDAIEATPPAPDGSIRLMPGVNVPKEVLAGVAGFLAGKASNAPVRFIDGITLSTSHLNKGLSLAGVRSPVPSGISVVFDKKRRLLGFQVEGRW
jgi:hypothetical protein